MSPRDSSNPPSWCSTPPPPEGAALLRIRLQKLLLARPGKGPRDADAVIEALLREHPSTVPPAKLTVGWLLDNRALRPPVQQLAGGAARHPEGAALAGFPVHRRTGDRPGGAVRVTRRVPAAAAPAAPDPLPTGTTGGRARRASPPRPSPPGPG